MTKREQNTKEKPREHNANQEDISKTTMKKSMGLTGGICLIIGTSIGSGIYVSPKGVLAEAGSVGTSMLIWTLGGLISLLGALAFSELGTLIPKSGGGYAYLMAGLGKHVAFLFAWTRVVVLTPSAIAIGCLIFAEYTVKLFPYCGNPILTLKLVAALAIVSIGIVNCWSATIAARIEIYATVLNIMALSTVIIGGFIFLSKGHFGSLLNGFDGESETVTPSNIAISLYHCLWAYDGWYILTFVTEELRNPSVNLPRANIIGVIAVITVYLLTNMSYFVVLSEKEIISSNTIAMKWAEVVLGKVGIIMPLFVMIATLFAANGDLYAGSRIVYAASREGQLPEILSYLNCKRSTPVPSIIITCTMALLMLIPFGLGNLIIFFGFADWLFHGLTVVSLMVLRKTMKDKQRAVKMNLILAVIFVVFSACLVITPIVHEPRIEFLYAGLFIVGGLVLYLPLVGIQARCLDYITIYLQMLLEAVPSCRVEE